jgi:hypothetical protein
MWNLWMIFVMLMTLKLPDWIIGGWFLFSVLSLSGNMSHAPHYAGGQRILAVDTDEFQWIHVALWTQG